MKKVLFIFMLVFALSSVARAGDGGLKRALKEYLLANSRWPDALIAVDNVEVAGEGLPKHRFDDFQVSSRNSGRTTGRVSFNVALMSGGRRVGAVVATAHVRVLRRVVAAVRPIKMREEIGAGDVKLVSMDVSAIPASAAFSVDDVVGKAAKRHISAGRVVREDYLQRPRMVKRGQTLEVRVQGVNIIVRSRATAKNDGFFGSPVKAMTSGGREISGLVSGPGRMVVNLR